MNNKILVSFFSASGVTKMVAERISGVLGATLFEIEPVVKYTSEDLDWTNKESRSSVEMQNKSFRPPVKNKVNNINDYNTVIIGFPVWWYTAPTIINTFIEENNLSGKQIFIFVTSGGSSFEGSLNDLKNTYPNLNFVRGKRFNGTETNADIVNWIS